MKDSKSKTVATKKARKPKCKIESNNIKALREKKGISQNELALLCGTNAAHISRIESGKRCHVSIPVGLRISKVLGEPLEKVFICKF